MLVIHKKENEVAYLQSTGNELTTELENDGYILLTGSSFNEEGEAYVQGKAVGVKRYIIDTKGRIVREAKFSGKKLKNYEYRKPFSFPLIKIHRLLLMGLMLFQKGGNMDSLAIITMYCLLNFRKRVILEADTQK